MIFDFDRDREGATAKDPGLDFKSLEPAPRPQEVCGFEIKRGRYLGRNHRRLAKPIGRETTTGEGGGARRGAAGHGERVPHRSSSYYSVEEPDQVFLRG